MPCIDMPRFRFHLSLPHIDMPRIHGHVTHITIRDGTITYSIDPTFGIALIRLGNFEVA
jgi:hypothetical protein